MATAMISNFFVANFVSAFPPPPVATETHFNLSGVTDGYSLNYAWTWHGDSATYNLNAINIAIPSIYQNDGLMIYSYNSTVGGGEWSYTNAAGTASTLKNSDYRFYKFCDTIFKPTADCENDIFNDNIYFLVSVATNRLAKIVIRKNNVFVDARPGEGTSLPKSSVSPVNQTAYDKERPVIAKVIDNIIKNLADGKPIGFTPAISPETGKMADSLKQIGSYNVRRDITKSYFSKYFNKCDVNEYSSIYFDSTDRGKYNLNTITTPARDKVANNPNENNRPRIDIQSGSDAVTPSSGGYLFGRGTRCGNPDSAARLAMSYRPATTWVLEKTGRTGATGFWHALGSPTLDRVAFYFKMQKVTYTGAADDIGDDRKNAYDKLNALSDYVFLCIQVYGNDLYVDFYYSDYGFSVGNEIIKGVVSDVSDEASFLLAHTFSINVAQFTFNIYGDAKVWCNGLKNQITVLKNSTAPDIASINKGPNTKVHVTDTGPVLNKGCAIDSDVKMMNIDGVSSLTFQRSINSLNNRSGDQFKPYLGYLSAWKIEGVDSLAAGIGGTKTQDTNDTIKSENDDSCGCGEVSGADITMILKRAFCAVICWTFNVGKGLQENATCLFNDALGTLGRSDSKKPQLDSALCKPST
jgi:hypothetical protein